MCRLIVDKLAYSLVVRHVQQHSFAASPTLVVQTSSVTHCGQHSWSLQESLECVNGL